MIVHLAYSVLQADVSCTFFSQCCSLKYHYYKKYVKPCRYLHHKIRYIKFCLC